jgi:N-acetylmuramoyl-L-alanine amidase
MTISDHSPLVLPDPTDDPFEAAARRFEPKTDYNRSPHLWGSEKLGEFWWSAQREIHESLRDHRYTAVQSCHDAGKSHTAARAIAKWIDVHPEGEAFVVSTAPTNAQVKAILWRELGKAHKKGNLTGRIVASGYPEWKLDDGELVGYGRKPADYDQSAFQGIHARWVLVVIDEACGIDANLFNAVDALVTNEYARVLAIGNPDYPKSHFAEICKPDSGWNVLRIDGLRTPNFTEMGVAGLECHQCRKAGQDETLLARLFREENIPFSTETVPESLRPMLLSPLWVEERLHRWVGRPGPSQRLATMAAQSSLFTSKVRGLFPDTNTEGVIPLGWVEQAMARWRDWRDNDSPPPPGRVLVGADIAGQGEDETSLAIRKGQITMEIRKYRYADTMEVTGYIGGVLDSWSSDDPLALVDGIGIGAGVIDRMRELEKPVHPFTASASATHLKDRSGEFGFMNQRSAAWWNLRELLDPSRGFQIAIPDDEMLKADLTAPRWKVLSNAKIQIESKDDIKKRLGRSTDAGDSVVQVHWLDAGTGAPDPGAVSWWDGLAEDEVVPWGIDADTLARSLGQVSDYADREGW